MRNLFVGEDLYKAVKLNPYQNISPVYSFYFNRLNGAESWFVLQVYYGFFILYFVIYRAY